MRFIHFSLAGLFLLFSSLLFAAPPLPSGLDNNKPKLPAGLGAPNLPDGLSTPPKTTKPENDVTDDSDTDVDDEPFISVTGFWDTRGGIRTQSDPYQDQFSLGETRLQLELQKEIGPVTARVVTDFLYDALAPSQHIDLQTGAGWLDLREANLAFSPFSFIDISASKYNIADCFFILEAYSRQGGYYLAAEGL